MLIIDAQTGTVLDANECYLVDFDELPSADKQMLEDGNDSDAGDVARRNGRKISSEKIMELSSQLDAVTQAYQRMRSDLKELRENSGDLCWANCVPYSAEAIREVLSDEAERMTEGQSPYSPEQYKAIYFGATYAENSYLDEIGRMILEGNEAWNGWRERICLVACEVYDKQRKD